MPRTRQRTNVGDDGGAFDVQHRPPAEHLPPGFADLLAEYDRINTELAEHRRNASHWRASLEADEFAALKADAAAAGQAARDGGKVDSPTAHIDEVRGRLRQATDRIPALESALELVRLDLQAARTKAQDADKGDQVEDAHKQLLRSADELSAAVNDYLAALARHEWLYDHKPWDTSAVFTLDQLPGIRGLVDVRLAQVAAPSLIKLITEL